MIGIKFEIKESEQQIQLLIMRALAESLTELFLSKKEQVKTVAQHEFLTAAARNQTFNDIIDGNLRYELGLLNPQSKITDIIVELATNLEVISTPIKFRDNIFIGGLTINAVKSDYSEVLGLAAAKQETEKGETLPWLEWLLTGGSKVLIANYHVRFGFFSNPPSRTGGAIMVRGGRWSLATYEQEHVGSRGDNFITRIIEDMEKPLRKGIIKCLKSA